MAGLYKPIANRNTSGAGRRSSGGGQRMFGWLRPSSLSKPKSQFGTRVVGYHPPSSASGLRKTRAVKPISFRTNAPRRRRANPNSFGNAIPKGGYGSNFHRGTSQGTGAVRQHGLVWGGRVFHSRSEFSRSLSAHGSSIATFQKRHGRAAAGLTTSFSKSKLSR